MEGVARSPGQHPQSGEAPLNFDRSVRAKLREIVPQYTQQIMFLTRGGCDPRWIAAEAGLGGADHQPLLPGHHEYRPTVARTLDVEVVCRRWALEDQVRALDAFE